MSFANLFLPKECLAENPWEIDPVNRETWVDCQYKKAKINSYTGAIVLLILMILTVFYLYYIDNKFWAIVAGLVGVLLLIGTLFTAPWWAGRKAGMEFDQFDMKWQRLLKDNNGDTAKTREIFGREKLKQQEIASQYAIADANRSRAPVSASSGFAAGFGAALGNAVFSSKKGENEESL